jgi:hypothetical protein
MKEYEAAARPTDIATTLGGGSQEVLKAQAAKEEIDLLEKQIAVVTRHIQQTQSLEQKE